MVNIIFEHNICIHLQYRQYIQPPSNRNVPLTYDTMVAEQPSHFSKTTSNDAINSTYVPRSSPLLLNQ